MTGSGHLWAVGFEGTDRAAQVRDEITRLGREKHDLNLIDVAVAVRFADGSLTLNGEPLPVVIKSHGGTIARPGKPGLGRAALDWRGCLYIAGQSWRHRGHSLYQQPFRARSEGLDQA